MLKPVIFLSLYTAAGIGSWSAYSLITEQDTSINSLTKLAAQIQPASTNIDQKDVSNIIYRWKDHKGTWNYEDSPYSELSFDSYEDELKFLKKLKASRDSVTASTSHIGEGKPTTPESESLSAFGQIKKLFADAKNVEHLLNQRQQELEEIVKKNAE